MFADFFKSVYRVPTGLTSMRAIDNLNVASELRIERTEILNAINELVDNPNYGPDKVPPYFLKRCVHSLCDHLLVIFNKSLSLGTFPERWKTSFIQPIHKKGSKKEITNYRPISILSCIPKLFDKIVANKLSDLLTKSIITEQHGFLKGKSTTTNLLVYNNFISKAFADHDQVDAIYMDFSKAFDSVQHPLLIEKLYGLGVRGRLLDWIRSYLSGRKQIVRLKGVTSNAFSVTSGVPQGSHLGPLLFLVFINDIKKVIKHVSFLLYADDIKIFYRIKSPRDAELLQSDLAAIQQWCIANELSLNIDKCHTITFSKQTLPTARDYTLDGRILKKVKTVSDLGVIYDSKLNFHDHIEHVNSKAHQALGFLIRNTADFRGTKSLIYLYKTLVLPNLFYCSQIWSPHTKSQINIVESSQHRFVRYLCYKSKTPMSIFDHVFPPKLERFNLPTIKSFHTCYDNTLMFKILNKEISCDTLNEWFTERNTTYALRNPQLLAAESNYAHYNSNNRLINNWNKLPYELRSLNNYHAFKKCNYEHCLKFT